MRRSVRLTLLPAVLLALTWGCVSERGPVTGPAEVAPGETGSIPSDERISLPGMPVPPQNAPLDPFGGFLNQFRNLAGETNAAVEEENALALAYIGIPKRFHPDSVTAASEAIYQAAFGVPFVVGESGIYAIGNPGTFDPSQYQTAISAQGGSAPIEDLHVWPFDPTADGSLIPFPAGSPYTDFEAYFYSARFGASDPNTGYAVRLVSDTTSVLVFVPAVRVPDGGLITAEDAGAFLALAATGGIDEDFDFLAWASSRGAGKAIGRRPAAGLETLPRGAAGKGASYCNTEALAECLAGVIADYENTLDSLKGNYDQKVNQIYHDYGKDAPATLGGAIGTGVVGGALAGSPGGPVGAAVGAGIGFISAGVGWLIYEAFEADNAEDDLKAAKDDYDEQVCQASRDTADDAVACFDEYCPEYAAWARSQMDQALAQMGC